MKALCHCLCQHGLSGSPFTKSGFFKAAAILTLRISSSEAMYSSLPWNCCMVNSPFRKFSFYITVNTNKGGITIQDPCWLRSVRIHRSSRSSYIILPVCRPIDLRYQIAPHYMLPQSSKTFVIRSFFFEKWLLTHVFGGSQGQKFSCKQACVELLTFWPWYHFIFLLFFSHLLKHLYCIYFLIAGKDKIWYTCHR